MLNSVNTRLGHESEPPPSARGQMDGLLLGTFITLIAFGVVMVYSASAVFAEQRYGSGQMFLMRQAIYAVIGIGLMLFLAQVSYHRVRLATYPLLLCASGLLIAVTAGLGKSAGGASRWIHIGPINVQPSELAKLALVLWLAYSLSNKADRIKTFSVGFLPHVIVAGLFMLLCLRQPDFGGAIMLGLLTFALLFAAGAKLGYILGAVLTALPILYMLIVGSPYRMRRIEAFLAPFEHRHDAGYQIAESLMGFGAGGVQGVGIGDGKQKLFFLPEAHTDFISAIIGEELGFIGTCAVILAFLLVLFRGLYIAYRAEDDYGMYLATGLTLLLGAQAYTNLAVAMGLLPTKGLTLPFVSYGGSSLIVSCICAGILLSVSRHGGRRRLREVRGGHHD
ncbi:MAG: putative lipid II flippase FtsW [Myxococcales bacterium]|nr:putative lipid II flippase FtsW [Myxococcales bacterium]